MFNMQLCSSSKAPILKGDRFSKCQCHNDIERDQMKAISYSSVVANLMYEYAHTLILLLLSACWVGT